MIRSSRFARGVAAAIGLAAIGCAPRPRMCTASAECAAQAACVAGRCQLEKPNVRPAIDSARRVVVRPVDIAYLRPTDPPEPVPPLFALGRDHAIVLFRFSVELPRAANVVEAYLVLRRADVVDDDPTPISLHATRIVESWDSRSTSWAFSPQMEDTRAPTTLIEPSGPSLVRLDVRELVRNWTRHDPRDHGVGVVADNQTRTGTTFALRSMGGPDRSLSEATPGTSPGRPGEARSSSAPDVEPYLELYLR